MADQHLVTMVRQPVLGAVKTRLARQVGAAEAIRFYRSNLHRLIRTLDDPRWNLVLAVTPDTAIDFNGWPSQTARVAQGTGDLGIRMQRLFDHLPRGRAMIIGSDIPAINPGHINRAFNLLGSNDAVFGPAPDGGYWLVGLKRFPTVPRAFHNVRWSSEHTLSDTERALSGYAIAHADTLEDVDDAASFKRWRASR